MMEIPGISVIIPTYNYGQYVLKAIDSVLPQLGDRHELIVIDDGSTDDTQQRLASHLPNLPANVHLLTKRNGGAASARNYGIQNARGNFMLFLDADDELLPRALAHLSRHIAENPDSRVILGGYLSVWPDGKSKTQLPDNLPQEPLERLHAYLFQKRISFSHGASAVHRDVFTHGAYPEQFRSQEDIPVFAQALANFRCSILRQPLALIRKHQDSLRHQAGPALSGGLDLVEEVFSPSRLGPEFQCLKRAFYLKRCLTLFRIAYLSGDLISAKHYFNQAVLSDWKILLKKPVLVIKGVLLWIKTGAKP